MTATTVRRLEAHRGILARVRLAVVALAGTAGCFASARPVKQMDAGDIMIGSNVSIPGSAGDPDFAAWFRVAPYASADVTAGALVTIPFTADSGLPGYGGLAQIRQHIGLTEGWRLVLDAEAQLLRLHIRRDWTNHWRASFVPYFVADTRAFTMYFGPKIGWLSGIRHVSSPDGANPLRPVGGAPGLIFAGGSVGAEDSKPPWFFSAIGGALDVGAVIDPDTGVVEVPISYSMSFYFAFL